MCEKYENKLYEAETLIEAFEVLKDMVDTLMGEIIESHPPPMEKVDYEDLDLPGQNESSNYEQMIKKYQAEIRTMTRLQCETENLIRELHGKLDSVQTQVKEYELLNQVGRFQQETETGDREHQPKE